MALLRDVVYYCTSFDVLFAVLSLDQEKAFDRVEWNFMRSTLSTMGFGPSFISWVNLFYSCVQSAFNVNGYLSPFFHLNRGVHQGCPLSPLLYVLVSEVLAVNIRWNPRISGLSLPGQPPLSPISQYADDTSLILSSNDAIKIESPVLWSFSNPSLAVFLLLMLRGEKLNYKSVAKEI